MTARRALLALLTVASLASGLAASAASADIAGPDDSLQQAFGPLAPASWYAGAFASPTDIDYLAVDVPQANTALHVDVENTVGSCTSVDLDGCPVWGTLVDAQGLQVGGEGSTAGTGEVDAGASDAIDWTFTAPGVYYLAMDSSGDLPTYRVRETITAPAPGSSGGAGGRPTGSGTAPGGAGGSSSGPAAALVLRSHQHGTAVRARIVVLRPLRSLTLRVTRGRSALASERLSLVGAGTRVLTLRLSAAGRRALAQAGSLRLTVRLLIVPATGRRLSIARTVVLDRRPAAR